uniref:Uncharacterized protein n=1 Tax=Daphnia galeata TaxID=27404 RepID=A0A8J2RYY0_9CRUS|nr:unnamed protein product [Daphnia galeata]
MPQKSTNEIDILHSDTPEFISPFELLPLPVLKEILALIQKRRGITIVRYVKTIFNLPSRRSLKLLEDYAGSMKNENILVVNLASIRCLQMKSLQIKGYPYGDDFMAFAIPKEFIAERCSHITDAGMQEVCVVGVDHLGKEVEGIGQCKVYFEHLATDDTRITSVGVKLGIRNLPKLKRWKMVSAQLLAEVYQEDSISCRPKLLETPKYSLIHLDVKGTQYTSGSLGLAVSNVPLCDPNGGVTPLLKAFGSSSLKFLKLSYFPQVNIDVIIQHCPNLHSLNLEQNYHYRRASPEEEEVTLGAPCKPPELHQLRISRAWNWPVCASISKKGIDVLMDSRNAIKEIELNHCAKITSSHILAWEKQASSNFWDLAIHYEEYSSEFESSEYEMDFAEIGANVA